MSGPVAELDAPTTLADCSHPSAPCVRINDSREERLGRVRVRRALPRQGRRTVGACCFADHMGPADVTENSGLDVGPHPHIGLQTLTWLTEGQVLHRDSLGSEQVIKPRQLNLMTAGNAVSHAEEATGHYRGTLQGIQLWVAQPEATRHGAPAFEHHDRLPQSDLHGAAATVLVGDFADVVSPARHDTPLAAVDLALHRSTTVPLRADFEYAVVVLEGATRAILLGGEPFEELIVMWWNFVGRARSEIDAAYTSWARQDDRFGTVRSTLPLIPAKAPSWHQGPVNS
jgi:quercetin 2,3-dioxygenase